MRRLSIRPCRQPSPRKRARRECPWSRATPPSTVDTSSAHLDGDRHAKLPHAPQMPEMRANCNRQRSLADISNVVPEAVPLHDACDRWIVGVRNTREKVVLDLKVEPAENPGQDAVAGTEIDGRLHLVDGPHTPR